MEEEEEEEEKKGKRHTFFKLPRISSGSKKKPSKSDEPDAARRRKSMSAIVLPKIDLDLVDRTVHSPSPKGPVEDYDPDDEGDDDDDQSSATTTTTGTPHSAENRSSSSGGRGWSSPVKKSPTPIIAIGVDPLKPHASIQNSEQAKRRYDRLLKRGPPTGDCPGFLFARRFVGDAGGDLYCEIGSVAEKSDLESPLNMAHPETAWWPVQRHVFCKRLVYLLLDTMRVLRYATTKHYMTGHDMCVSVNKNTRVIVKDRMWRFYEVSVTETMPILATRSVFKSWFMVSSDVAEEIIEKVVNAVNAHWKI